VRKKHFWNVYFLQAQDGDEAAAELVRCAQNFSPPRTSQPKSSILDVKTWYYANSGLGSIGARILDEDSIQESPTMWELVRNSSG